jgi:hypothetical protein
MDRKQAILLTLLTQYSPTEIKEMQWNPQSRQSLTRPRWEPNSSGIAFPLLPYAPWLARFSADLSKWHQLRLSKLPLICNLRAALLRLQVDLTAETLQWLWETSVALPPCLNSKTAHPLLLQYKLLHHFGLALIQTVKKRVVYVKPHCLFSLRKRNERITYFCSSKWSTVSQERLSCME